MRVQVWVSKPASEGIAMLSDAKARKAQPGEKEEAEPAEQAAAQKDAPEPSEDENG